MKRRKPRPKMVRERCLCGCSKFMHRVQGYAPGCANHPGCGIYRPVTVEEQISPKTEGIDRVEAAASPEWKRWALECVRAVARRQQKFNADDIFEEMQKRPDLQTHNPKALGAVMRRVQVEGIATITGDTSLSKRDKQHNCPIRWWRSLTYHRTELFDAPTGEPELF